MPTSEAGATAGVNCSASWIKVRGVGGLVKANVPKQMFARGKRRKGGESRDALEETLACAAGVHGGRSGTLRHIAGGVAGECQQVQDGWP